MNKLYTLALLAALSSPALLAQSPVIVTDHDGNVVNEQSIVGWGDPGQFELSVSLRTESDESFNQIVNVKRYELSVVDSTKNMFCWGVCYNPIFAGTQPLWVSDDWVNMDPDSVYEAFHAYYRPYGHSGTMCFRYVWFSTSDSNDSTWVDICFNTMTAIGEVAPATNAFDVHPNPAVGQDLTVDLALSALNGTERLVLWNVLGERAMSRSITANNGRIVLGTSDLEAGVYFATVERNGLVLTTRRVVISH